VELLGRYSNPRVKAADLRRLLGAAVWTKAAHGQERPERRKDTQRRLRAAEIDELVAAYQAGCTVPDLVAQFGIHRTTVLAHLQRRGIGRRAQQRKLPDAQVEEASRLDQAGMSLAELGQRFDVNPATVNKELRRAGVPIRPRRGW
jgi:lambda repressor-like predicted transcriptional regulator